VKRFDGWEPATAYEHDEQGRLVRSVPEQEWDEQQQAHMLALAAYRATLCPACGGFLPDTTEAEAEDRYHCGPPHVCHRCVALDIATKSYVEDPHPSSLLFIPERRR
jgi:ribosomal protein S27AE